MKLLVSPILFISLSIFSQNAEVKGHVISGEDNSPTQAVEISLLKNDRALYTTQTDKNGDYNLNNVEIGHYDFKIIYLGYRVKIIPNFNVETGTKKFDFSFPERCKISTKICPENHSNNIIPIVYGLPGKKNLKKAEKEKIKLGGCEQYECDPKWYCKTHNLEF